MQIVLQRSRYKTDFNLSLSFSFYIVLQLILSILQLMSESFALFVGPQISWTTVRNLHGHLWAFNLTLKLPEVINNKLLPKISIHTFSKHVMRLFRPITGKSCHPDLRPNSYKQLIYKEMCSSQRREFLLINFFFNFFFKFVV